MTTCNIINVENFLSRQENEIMELSLTEKFAKKIKLLRFKRGISQEAFAEIAGISRGVMGQIERAEISTTLISVEKIAKAFNISILELFDFSDIY